MPKDINAKDLVGGEIVTVKFIVREVGTGESGDNVRLEPYSKGNLGGTIPQYSFNSAQVEVQVPNPEVKK